MYTTLFLKVLSLLSEIPEIKFSGENFNQLTETRPPVEFPCSLVKISFPRAEEFDQDMQDITASIEITTAFKIFDEVNSLMPAEQQQKALSAYQIFDKVYKKFQGYEADQFDAISFVGDSDANVRKGLKVKVQRFETSFKSDLKIIVPVVVPIETVLARYFAISNFKKEENLYLPQYGRYIIPGNSGSNTNSGMIDGMNNDHKLDIVKMLGGEFYVLPEVVSVQKFDKSGKNPHLYNVSSANFCNIYFCNGSSNFAKNSVKKAIKAGARECILFFGNLEDKDATIAYNLASLQAAFQCGNDKNIEKIIFVTEEKIMSYTRTEILNLEQ